jgi:hypothetical protein
MPESVREFPAVATANETKNDVRVLNALLSRIFSKPETVCSQVIIRNPRALPYRFFADCLAISDTFPV